MIIKKIILKVVLLFLIILGLNYVYQITLLENDLSTYAKENLEINNSHSNTDIYYFGESSNITYKQNDSTKKSISEMCNLFFPGLKFRNINKYATHAGVYKFWLKQLKLQNSFPKAIIITTNLRSFDAAWIHSKLETQLQQSLVFSLPYPNIINRFLLSLQAFDNKTEGEREIEMLNEWKTVKLVASKELKYSTVDSWNGAVANGSYLNPDGSWDMRKIELACHYIKSFAFTLDANNKRINDFDEITDWCYSNNINLYLNLLAENIEYADSLVGKDLVFLMRQNRDFIKARYQKNNCIVIDNLESVKGANFIDTSWTTEHYDYKGRMKIAKNISQQLKIQFKSEYKKAY